MTVRRPAVAGTFYPANPSALRGVVEKLLQEAAPDRDSAVRRRVRGLVVPHAGYVFSGAVAATAFACVMTGRHSFSRAAIVGPAHYRYVAGVAAPSAARFATPLGEVDVDGAAIAALVADGLVIIDDEAHRPEHSLEVELPFLQTVYGATAPVPQIVPLLVGGAGPQTIADILERLWDDDTLVVLSTDLSHYHAYDVARARDAATASAIEALDVAAIAPDGACGHAGLRGLLIEVRRRDYAIGRRGLMNSGDTAGDKVRVVGYGAWLVTA